MNLIHSFILKFHDATHSKYIDCLKQLREELTAKRTREKKKQEDLKKKHEEALLRIQLMNEKFQEQIGTQSQANNELERPVKKKKNAKMTQAEKNLMKMMNEDPSKAKHKVEEVVQQ